MIDKNYLRQVACDKTLKTISCTTNVQLWQQFKITLKILIQFVRCKFSAYELANFIQSQDFYFNKKGQTVVTTYKRGTILLVDFGSNTGTEICYEHPCVVIENEYRDIFVVPTSSGIKITDKKGKIYSCYIPVTTAEGFDRNTTIILNSAKWISKARVVKELGSVEPQFFKIIYNRLFEYTFRLKQKDILYLENIKSKLLEENNNLKERNADLLTQIEAIKSKTG